MDHNILRIVVFGLVTFFVAMLITPSYIALLRRLKLAKQIRTEASMGGGKATKYHTLHAHKQGTPNMGGGMILIVVAIMVLLTVFVKSIQTPLGLNFHYTLWNRNETYLPLFALFSMGILGAVDDYMNVRNIGGKKGMSARVKMLGLTIFAFLGAYWFSAKLGHDSITIPGFGPVNLTNIFEFHIAYTGVYINLYIIVAIFVIIAMANSVNITDGLDGLAGGLLAQNYFLYAFIAYNENLFLLSTICVVIAAALAAFLWFNIKPAQFYLGDAGALGLGGGLAVMALMTDTLVVLIIISLIYIWEILSVIIQITSKKLRRGKKVFLIAPYHHHLEAKGMMEETIVMKFWLIGALLSAAGLIFYLLPPLW